MPTSFLTMDLKFALMLLGAPLLALAALMSEAGSLTDGLVWTGSGGRWLLPSFVSTACGVTLDVAALRLCHSSRTVWILVLTLVGSRSNSDVGIVFIKFTISVMASNVMVTSGFGKFMIRLMAPRTSSFIWLTLLTTGRGGCCTGIWFCCC